MIKRLAEWSFRCFCKPAYFDDIWGDLEELYHENLKYSRFYAERKILADVLLLFRLNLIKSIGENSIINTGMFKNYFKISIRNLLQHKFYTFINITGLAIGLAAFLLISLYTSFEKSYDRFFSQSAQMYRLTTDLVNNGVIGTRDAMSFHPSGKALKEELPEVLDYTTTYKFDEVVFRQRNGRVRFERSLIAADSNYFKLFDYQVLQGDPKTALNDPYAIVLTESKAKSYFGDTSPVGQTLELLSGFNRSFKVTGVIEDVPENTHYKFDMILSLKSLQSRLDRDAWNGFNYYTYLLMDENAQADKMTGKLQELSKKYLGEDNALVFNLQPMEDIHLYSNFTYEPEIHGNARAVEFLTIIAFFVLIIAWVNYVNLSTARAIDRAKEVGLRKVIGATKSQLIGQFLFESLLVNLIGALLAVLLAEIALPLFNQLASKTVALDIWDYPGFVPTVLVFFLLGSFLTGFYPALVLSGFEPVTVLKGKFRNSKKGTLLRKGLVVAQFAVSLTLISGTFIVIRQVDYMRYKDKGFEIDRVIAFNNPRVPDEQAEARDAKVQAFYETLRKNTAIVGVGATSNLPGGGSSDINSTSGEIRIVGLTDPIEVTTYVQYIDDQFVETMKMTVLEGRNFNKLLAADTGCLLVNEAFLQRFNLPDYQEVLNKNLKFGNTEEGRAFKIIGVINDFNRTSLKQDVEPTVYGYAPENSSRTVVKIENSNYQAGISFVRDTWDTFFPNHPLDIKYLDQRFEQLFSEDKRFGSIFGAFAGLAILIAILGLFGLSSFMAVQRTKEVGVRKVLGASSPQIIGIFYKDFALLISLAALLGLPVIYWVMDNWLDNYAYRIHFPWWVVVNSLLMVLVFALLTVGLQVYKVAAVNPARTIRYE